LPSNDDYEHNFAELPDVLPSGRGLYWADPARVGKGKQAKGKESESCYRFWEPVQALAGKLISPFAEYRDRGGFRGSVWFARAQVSVPEDTPVWVALAAADHGKLWVNDRLAWVGSEAQYRSQAGREAIFKVSLRKGVNHLLIRCREDRGETWVRMHFCLQGAPQDQPPVTAARAPLEEKRVVGPLGDGAGRFPGANPPLAWDLEKGVNVLWKAELPAPARYNPAAIGGRLFYCTKPDGLCCLDQATGKLLWQEQAGALAPDDAGKGAKTVSGDWAEPLSDGESVWVHHGAHGVAACLDANGKRKWAVQTGFPRAALLVVDGRLVIEGGSPPDRSGKGVHVLLALDFASGKELWKKDLGGGFGDSDLYVLRLANRSSNQGFVASTAGWVASPDNGAVVLSGLDADPSPGSKVYLADQDLYYGKLSRTTGVRFFLNDAGQVGHRVLWRNNYFIKYDRPIMCFAWGDWFMHINTVQEDCKGHSNSARREVYAYDRDSGRPLVCIKPALDAAQADFSQSVSAGSQLFVHDSGGGASGGNDKYGQIAILDLSSKSGPQPVCQNYIQLGSSAPVFDGDKMFLRHNQTVWCVAATTPAGRRYQDEKVAQARFDAIGAAPSLDTFAKPEPLAAPPPVGSSPISRLTSEVGLENWLLAAPVPLPGPEQAAAQARQLAALRPKAGDQLEIAGVSRPFEPLPQLALAIGYTFSHPYYFCGIGERVSALFRNLDILSCTGDRRDQCGYLYTVVFNSRPRVASLVFPPSGLDVWLSGRKITAYESVELGPGFYPLLVRVRPDKFGPKDRSFSVAFNDLDHPQQAYRAWLRKVNADEPRLRETAEQLAGTKLAAQAERLLRDLEDYKIELDLADTTRSWRSGGSGRFGNARPPVPMERSANLKWTAPLPGAAGPGPVAAGEHVFVSADPGTVLCLSAASGQVAWQAAVGNKDGTLVSAPAACQGLVYVATSAGEVFCVCLRADGQKAWTKTLPGGKGSAGRPVVLTSDGLLLVQAGALHRLDAKTGAVLWSADLKSKTVCAAPVTAVVRGQRIIVTGAGSVLSADHGQALTTGLPELSLPAQIGGDTAYLAFASEVGAYDLAALAGGSAHPVPKWQVSAKATVTAGPLLHEGLLYFIADQRTLCALEADTGKEVYRQDLADKAGRNGRDLLLAGRLLYATNQGADARTIVVKPGRKFEKVWEYGVPGGGETPYFLGRSAFVRAGTTLFAIGGVPPRQPEEFQPPEAIAVEAGFAPPPGVPVTAFESNAMPTGWLMAGPFKPRSLKTDFLESLGGVSKARPGLKLPVKYKDAELAFQALDPKCIWRDPKFTAGFDSVDVAAALANAWDSTACFYTVIHNDAPAPRVVELVALSPGGERWNTPDRLEIQAWAGATRLAEGKLYLLPKGPVPFMVVAGLGTLQSAGKVWMSPRFRERPEYAARMRHFEEQKRVWAAYQARGAELFVLSPAK